MTSDAPATTSQQYRLLSAAYLSPSNAPFTLAQKLPAPPTNQPRDKAAYLGALRRATCEMQEQINKQLTSRMEEDRAREAGGTSGASTAQRAVDEAKEDDNYGEEGPEED